MASQNLYHILLVYYVTVCVTPLSGGAYAKPSGVPRVESSNLSRILAERCALLGVPPYHDNSIPELLDSLQRIYEHDSGVLVGQFHAAEVLSETQSTIPLAYSSINNQSNLVLFKRNIKDRSCLIQPPNAVHRARSYSGELSVDGLVRFVNDGCGTFRTVHGTLTRAGELRERILGELYRLGRDEGGEACPRIKMPSTSVFVREYLLRSRPVVIEGAVNDSLAGEKEMDDRVPKRAVRKQQGTR